MDLEGNDSSLTEGNILNFSLRDWVKHEKFITLIGFGDEIWRRKKRTAFKKSQISCGDDKISTENQSPVLKCHTTNVETPTPRQYSQIWKKY